MADRTCVVFGAGQEFPDDINIPAGALVIAADGGYEKLKSLGISPDRVIGDLDSLGYTPESGELTLLPHIKDTTDTFEAVKLGIEAGCTEFRIYGGTGGRLDHTLANIQLAAMLAQKGRKPFIYGDGYVMTAVTDGSIALPARESGYVSVFAHSDVCEGVCISGLFYEVTDAVLKNDFALGVSNEFTGKAAVISVRKGTLCVYYEV